MIEYKNVDFGYSKEKILQNINVIIERGEYVLVIGPNGAGKSTFIKCMLGLVTPTHGEVTIDGISVKDFNNWNSISYVAQRATQLQTSLPISVAEIVSMGVTTKVTKEQILEQLRLVDMEEYLVENVHNLSGGQQQRVFIARALLSNPEIIVLDEPTVGLDVQTVKSFYELISKLHKLGKTVIMVTHDMHMLSEDADRVIAINHEIEFTGPLRAYNKWHHDICLYCGVPHKPGEASPRFSATARKAGEQ